MFSTEEAISFLQDTWGLQRVEQRFRDDRANLVGEIATAVQARVPFQSITLMATPPALRKRPGMEEIHQQCVAGVGGLCYNLNVFAWLLLRALGFNASLCRSTCYSTITSPNNHVVVIVHGIDKPGDAHLVECGVGFPTFRTVPLDFEEETPVFVDSFLEYKYIRHEGQILRMHGNGDTMKRNDPPIEGLDLIIGKWRRFYSFKPEHASYALCDFDAAFDKVFTLPDASPFHLSPRALAFPNRRAVAMVNDRMMVEGEGGGLERTVLDGDEAIVDNYREYFPALPEETVRKALHQWHSAKEQ